MAEPFPQFTEEDAPEKSKPILEEVKADFGMIPNLERTLAAAPAALEGYAHLWNLFGETSLTTVEQQVVYQTANRLNSCSYCVPWHTLLSKEAGVNATDIQALREGTPLSDEKLESLRQLTIALIENRGHPPESELNEFFEAGYTQAQAMEVILGLAVKLISNYTNGIAKTPLDPEVESLKWSP